MFMFEDSRRAIESTNIRCARRFPASREIAELFDFLQSSSRRQGKFIVQADAYVCANRTCEIGLKHAMGQPSESFLFSLEAATRNPGV